MRDASRRTESQPYNDLGPEVVLEAVERVGFVCDGHLLALNSFENRVYQVGIESGDPLVIKLYRPHRWSDAAIGEEHAFARELVEHEIPLVPPMRIRDRTLFEHAGYRYSLSRRCGGRAVELDREEVLAWLGRFVGRMHAVGAAGTFLHRPRLDVARFGWESLEYLMENQWIPMHMESTFRTTAETLLSGVEEAFSTTRDVPEIRLHGDFHAGNILWREGPHFVDLDDCLLGPPVQDLWLLLSGDRDEMSAQAAIVLEGYEMFQAFDHRQWTLVEPLRSLRMLHHAAWLARRWDDPAFPPAFPWFDTPQYWNQLAYDLQVQVDALQRPPPAP